MNKRIKELLLKSGFTNTYNDPKDGFELEFVDEEHTLESVTKFAELIVQECMQVTTNYPHPQTKLTAAEHIARHFGIK